MFRAVIPNPLTMSAISSTSISLVNYTAGAGVEGDVGLGGEHRVPVVGAADAAAAVVVDLHEDLGPMPLYRLGDGPVRFDDLFEVACGPVCPTRWVHHDLARRDETESPLRPLGVVVHGTGAEQVPTVVALGVVAPKIMAVRCRHQPVPQGNRTDLDWRKEVGELFWHGARSGGRSCVLRSGRVRPVGGVTQSPMR